MPDGKPMNIGFRIMSTLTKHLEAQPADKVGACLPPCLLVACLIVACLLPACLPVCPPARPPALLHTCLPAGSHACLPAYSL